VRSLEQENVMSVVAKFCVNAIELFKNPAGAINVKLNAVYRYDKSVSGNACLENRIFGDATPNGNISMYIQNPSAAEWFKQRFADSEPGKACEVFVTFSDELPDDVRSALSLPQNEK
jgi:hypothetical protein